MKYVLIALMIIVGYGAQATEYSYEDGIIANIVIVRDYMKGAFSDVNVDGIIQSSGMGIVDSLNLKAGFMINLLGDTYDIFVTLMDDWGDGLLLQNPNVTSMNTYIVAADSIDVEGNMLPLAHGISFICVPPESLPLYNRTDIEANKTMNWLLSYGCDRMQLVLTQDGNTDVLVRVTSEDKTVNVFNDFIVNGTAISNFVQGTTPLGASIIPLTSGMGGAAGILGILCTAGSEELFLLNTESTPYNIVFGSHPSADSIEYNNVSKTWEVKFSPDTTMSIGWFPLFGGTNSILEFDTDLLTLPYDTDVDADFTAGTIEADNGVDEAAWVVQAGDTIEIVGGVIVNIAHP